MRVLDSEYYSTIKTTTSERRAVRYKLFVLVLVLVFLSLTAAAVPTRDVSADVVEEEPCAEAVAAWLSTEISSYNGPQSGAALS